MTFVRLKLALVFVFGMGASIAFLPLRKDASRVRPLYDIHEWRDLEFNFPGTSDDRRLGVELGPPPKEICILPFPYEEVLLQGETKQLRLYEDRFIRLFEDCLENHRGVVAMGLLADSGIIQTVPLCEIEAYNRMEGFGIFVTIRVVSRAKLIDVTQQEPYLKAVCTEIADTVPPNLELPSLVASNIENFMLVLSSMEHRLNQAKRDDECTEEEEDAAMQQRITLAKLEDRFYKDIEDDEEEDSDDLPVLDRRARFCEAYEVALATDTQGYRVNQSGERTPQELNAVSWAAFCTEILSEVDAAYRIQALDADDLFERLKLASQMLRQKKQDLRIKMQKAGLKFGGEDTDGAGS